MEFHGIFCQPVVMSEADWCKDHEVNGTAGCLLYLYIQPGASKSQIKGVFPSTPPRLKISVAAPPTEGEANEALIRFLSKALEVAKSRIQLLSGETSRQKNVFVSELDSLAVLTRLEF